MSIKKTKHLLCFGIAILLSGCSLFGIHDLEDLPEELVFKTSEDTYTPGEISTLMLKNPSGPEIGVNLCDSDLQLKTDGSWETVMLGSNRTCLDYRIDLKEGDDITYEYELPTELKDEEPLQAGTYRFKDKVRVLSEDVDVEIVSEVFTIESQ